MRLFFVFTLNHGPFHHEKKQVKTTGRNMHVLRENFRSLRCCISIARRLLLLYMVRNQANNTMSIKYFSQTLRKLQRKNKIAIYPKTDEEVFYAYNSASAYFELPPG